MEEQPMSENKRDALFSNQKNGYDRLTAEDRQAMESYAKSYMAFLDAAKTEREAVTETIRQAEAAGFRAFVPGTTVQPGDRLYRNNRGKAITFAVIGKKSLAEGAHITAAHIDNPRLDLKPNPLMEDHEFAFFQTHYYGGVKKYQWTTIPLALHGVIALKDGSSITVSVGEQDNEPVFVITDLLVHLAQDQLQKTLANGITGENLKVFVGSEPLADDDGTDRVKLAVLCLLNEKYGIVEDDFISAELIMVPAQKAKEVGFDRSVIGAYGHDDRVCSFAAFLPLLDLETPDYTAVCTLADKEEIGSMGVSGMQSENFVVFMDDLCEAQGVSLKRCFENSKCLSADVTNAFDPIYPEVSDLRNNNKLNYGVGLAKYTGSRGKSGSSDAAAEYMAYVRRIFDEGGVIWQIGELGKVDQGGGGTVAGIMANRNIDTVDIGTPVLSMHAPFEQVSKLDAYMTMKAMKVFYNAD
jgi:aspartyl aminopeptidase